MKLARRTALLAAAVYPIFALGSYLFYPGSFSPTLNWLSDLGNTLVNTRGGILYNLGCVATALLLIVFYVSLNAWRNGDKVLHRLLTIAQISGVFSSASLVLAALYNIGTHPQLHGRLSMFLTIGLTWFLSFANTALMRHPRFDKRVAICGFVAAAATLVYGVFFNTPVGEWVAIGSFIAYVVISALSTKA